MNQITRLTYKNTCKFVGSVVKALVSYVILPFLRTYISTSSTKGYMRRKTCYFSHEVTDRTQISTKYRFKSFFLSIGLFIFFFVRCRNFAALKHLRCAKKGKENASKNVLNCSFIWSHIKPGEFIRMKFFFLAHSIYS